MLKKYYKLIICFVVLIVTFAQLVYANEAKLQIHSESVIAVDGTNGSLLYGENINAKIYPASTTKILTAILAIENLNLEDLTVASKSAVQLPAGSSHVGLKEGEIMSVNDLLYCLLLNSGNDAANVLAETISGSINSFVHLMNEKAIELGCTNTNFINTHGYHDPNHYTTSSDMMKMLIYATNNDVFKKIASTKTYRVNPTNITKKERILKNTNRLILTKEESFFSRFYEYAIGGKTGYTPEAKRALVAYGQKDDKFVLVGIFGAPPTSGDDLRYTDAIAIFEYVFNNFNRHLFAKKADYTFSYINSETNIKYIFGISKDLYLMSNSSNNFQISYNINIDETLLNSITSIDNKSLNKVVGKINFNITSENQNFSPYDDLVLLSTEQITTFSETIFLKILIILFTTLLVVIMLIFIVKKRNCIKKRKTLQKNKSSINRVRRRTLRIK